MKWTLVGVLRIKKCGSLSYYKQVVTIFVCTKLLYLYVQSYYICMYKVYSRTCQRPLDVYREDSSCSFLGDFDKLAKFHLNRFAINCHVDRISWQRRCLSKLWERLPWGGRPARQRLTNRGTSWARQGLLVRRRLMGQHHLRAANVSG